MKNKFFEYFEVSKEFYEDMWRNAIIVFDTNLLLNLYRYTPDTRDNVLSLMEKNTDRIWIPYQVGWEYFNNRLTVIEEVSNGCNNLKQLIVELRAKFKKHLDDNYKRHPYIDRKALDPLCKSALEPILKQLDEWKKDAPNYQDNDTILVRLMSLFDGRVGEDFSETRLNQLYEEGAVRYASLTPPGYMDLKEKKDRGNRHLYGDVIVWFQTIEKAKESHKNIIFVSDDQKEDWYEKKHHGKTAGPRYELFKEFTIKTEGQRILIYNQELFLQYANQYLNAEVKEESIKEVQEVALAEEEKRKAARQYTEEILRKYGYLGDMGDGNGISPVATATVNLAQIQRNFGIAASPMSQLQKIIEQQKTLNPLSNSLQAIAKAAEAYSANPFASVADQIRHLSSGIPTVTAVASPSEIQDLLNGKNNDE